jgi:hypothetical protein
MWQTNKTPPSEQGSCRAGFAALSFGLVHACSFAPFLFRLSSLRAVPIAAKLAATAAFFATRLTFADGDLDLARDLNFARFEEDFDLVRLAAFFMIPPGPLYYQ